MIVPPRFVTPSVAEGSTVVCKISPLRAYGASVEMTEKAVCSGEMTSVAVDSVEMTRVAVCSLERTGGERSL